MLKDKKNYYVHTVPLTVTPYADRKLRGRFKAAEQFYNAVLGETEKRRRKYQSHPLYLQAVKLDKTTSQKERKEFFRQAATETGYYEASSKKNGRDNSVVQYGYRTVRKSWIEDCLDAHSCNGLSARAFAASEKIIFNKAKTGRRAKKVNFCGSRNPMTSVIFWHVVNTLHCIIYKSKSNFSILFWTQHFHS